MKANTALKLWQLYSEALSKCNPQELEYREMLIKYERKYATLYAELSAGENGLIKELGLTVPINASLN